MNLDSVRGRRRPRVTSSASFGFVVVAALAAAPAAAQLVGIRVNPDAVKKYAGQTVARGAEQWIVGDAIAGMKVDAAAGKIDVVDDKQVVVCVADPNKPDAPLYEGRDKDGRLKPVSARALAVSRKDFTTTMVWDKVQNLTGLRDEYVRKRDEVDARRKQLATLKLGTAEWFELQRRLLVEVDALVGWLRSTLFAPAAAQWEKQYGAELKRAGAAASKSRLEEAKKINAAEVPEKIVEATKSAGKGDLKWHARESKHIRMVAYGEVSPSKVDAALLVGERIIESFRTDFIDPDLKEGDADPMPEEVWVEYYVLPDGDALGAKIWEEALGMHIGDPRDRRIKMNFTGKGGAGERHLLKSDGGGDLDGYVAHTLGHNVADLAFNGRAGMPAWIGEGFAYWISFEHLARNSVTCFAFSMPTYAKGAEAEGAKAVEQGMRAAFNDLAIRSGPSMSDLFQTPLVTMEAPHLAKAWSVIDWLVTKEPARLRAFIRGACSTQVADKTDIEKFRPKAMEIFEQKEGNVYAFLDEAWKKYAAASGGEAKPKKKAP